MGISSYGIEHHGLTPTGEVHWNLEVPELIERAVQRREGKLTAHGAFVTETVPRTGRSPNDKFIVREPSSEERIWWGEVNVETTQEVFDNLKSRVIGYLNGQPELYVQDVYCGWDPDVRLKVRVVNHNAWHNAFVHNMFVRPEKSALADHVPDFTVLHAPHLSARGELDGVSSDAFVIVHFAEKLVIIGGTKYAGEMKKSIFSAMNYYLPAQDILPMHCSANTTGDNTAIFFGLSGTGKTTLSADHDRALVGDDEHGWGPNGVFNFEGGCYAKMIRLSEKAEPEIYATTRRFGTILENVVLDDDRVPDFDDGSLSENSRGSYPLEFIDNRVHDGVAGHPQNVVFLTCDAFGVLPPVSRLTPEQAAYHFISGYTAKVAGTEIGIKEPVATFSACFGAPFMPSHPMVYADLLVKKMATHGATAWLLNTGWSGGPYGTGERMSIGHTRALLNAALDGTLDGGEFTVHPTFGVEVPTRCPGVPTEILNPKSTWTDAAAYEDYAAKLAGLFAENFVQFAEGCSEAVNAAGPKVQG
ncbi:MAG: phosphoenolpyruvate carboxykinase (ATP) [Myxococcales bacterium]|nr:phosphoenolpyruvate carboxykinase (ATP) [Myxococcales bacterium]